MGDKITVYSREDSVAIIDNHAMTISYNGNKPHFFYSPDHKRDVETTLIHAGYCKLLTGKI